MFLSFSLKSAIKFNFFVMLTLFVLNTNFSREFEIHGANLPRYPFQLTPLVGHVDNIFKTFLNINFGINS